MPTVEELKQILHEEKMNEPLPDTWEGQTTPEWEAETKAILDEHVPYWDKKVSITEYKERYIRPHMELQILDFQEALLDNAQHMLIIWAMYPFALLILIVFILNWG